MAEVPGTGMASNNATPIMSYLNGTSPNGSGEGGGFQLEGQVVARLYKKDLERDYRRTEAEVGAGVAGREVAEDSMHRV